MSKLIVTDGKDVLDTIELTPERITIGRHPDNSLQLNDKAVSGHHAAVSYTHLTLPTIPLV